MGAEIKHCQFCWAYYQRIKCIASPENRKVLCENAKNRMAAQKEKQKNANEAAKLKKYIDYIPKRIVFLRASNGGICSNEYKYYCALQEAIKQWGKTHVLFYNCICGKIGVKQATDICGISKNEFYRIMRKQRRALIGFIEKQERILQEKHPFIAFDIEV